MLVNKYKALVVDDDPIARKTVGFALEQENFHCAYAANGDDALKWMASGQFDLVVTDLRMPHKHGHALAVELLARKNRPVVAIHTSVDDPKLTKDLLARGVDDVVYKPTNYATFAVKMNALVRRRNKASEKAITVGTIASDAPRAGAQETEPRETDPLEIVPPKIVPPETSASDNIQFPVVPISRVEFERRLASVQHICPLSSAASEVFSLTTTEEATPGGVASVLLRDAALTADVLRLANSSYYKRNSNPTIDVEEAMRRIGYRRIGEIALALNALSAFRCCILPWLDADIAQARSLATSTALERCREVRVVRDLNDGTTLCAFLHSLGRLILGSAFQSEYQALIEVCSQRNAALCDLERHVFPESHSAALSHVLSKWNIPGGICGPLRYVADSYESIARLEEPMCSRVELIKIAVFIGDIAVGRWMSWDQVEPPPGHVLMRHHLPNLARLIEHTRVDVGQFANRQEAPTVKGDSDAFDQGNGGHGQRVLYYDLSGGRADWMPELLASLGIETIPYEPGMDEESGGVVVNCLNSRSLSVETSQASWSGPARLLLVEHNAPSRFDEYGLTVRFPASAAALRASCSQIATSGRPSKTQKALPSPEMDVSQANVLA
ncbi:MAG: HDOD domain-containing protein [Pirellulales bacterium]